MSPSKDEGGSGSGTSTPKIAIKGFSLSSKAKPSSATKPGAKPPSSLGKRPRSTFGAHENSDSEGEGGKGKHETVTHFGEQGAVKEGKKEEKN